MVRMEAEAIVLSFPIFQRALEVRRMAPPTTNYLITRGNGTAVDEDEGRVQWRDGQLWLLPSRPSDSGEYICTYRWLLKLLWLLHSNRLFYSFTQKTERLTDWNWLLVFFCGSSSTSMWRSHHSEKCSPDKKSLLESSQNISKLSQNEFIMITNTDWVSPNMN